MSPWGDIPMKQLGVTLLFSSGTRGEAGCLRRVHWLHSLNAARPRPRSCGRWSSASRSRAGPFTPSWSSKEPLMPEEVKAHITGVVFQVLAKPGDKVGAGDPIIVLGSMKMEIPVDAPRAGAAAAAK